MSQPSRLICRRVECAADKREVMQQLLSQATGQGVSVYIGDSASDLAAMLAADLGIVVGKSSSLRQVAAFCGVQLRPLVAGVLPALISPAPSAGDVGRPLVGLGWLVAGVPKVGRWKCATSMLRGRGPAPCRSPLLREVCVTCRPHQ